MGALLALASALFYGLADFAGGLLSRRARFTAVALVGQLGGLVLTLTVAPFVPAPGGPTAPDLAWGALSSLNPAIPVLLGITFLRERLRPSQVAGLTGAGAGAAIVLFSVG